MPAATPDQRQPDPAPLPALASRLGYLLKHAQLRLADLTSAAMAPFGMTGRECAVLIAIDNPAPLSQADVALRLGVDRTTMVLLIDDLESKGLVLRQRDQDDRRKNLVQLTPHGRVTLDRASNAGTDAERRFLSELPPDRAAEFTTALRLLAFPQSSSIS